MNQDQKGAGIGAFFSIAYSINFTAVSRDKMSPSHAPPGEPCGIQRLRTLPLSHKCDVNFVFIVFQRSSHGVSRR